ncbi:MAG: RNA-protein complex protein Nop10 [Thermoplasmata archaeon]|nr:MAG: RNA-protein complex protein Nop10 [Thermoplasmata archaeon]MCD6357171.1 RNA-protein complex protein Nop10 [Thermoproteales archaeon]RLF32725.1 MAG: RNA-protein complex protein Nop10 [Thermoplasmata archaeon]RLF40927.1 MAG: RNA-protein complex protein Nop10 [Thermoplasmata archaeon]HDN50422.1 RNA-protein complex protein Nop10 [Thermoplasmatales archaeon]
MRYCDACKRYTLSEVCPVCGGAARRKEPPRFSPQDPYGKYRRMLKRDKNGKV